MRRPNVVLITVECLRADHFGLLTPHLSALGEESIRFSEAYSAGGWTKISMMALMSSAYASMYGGSQVGMSTPARRALAECFLGEGYWTAGFTANPVCGNLTGFHRGFGHFRDARRQGLKLPQGAPLDPKKEWRQFAEMGIPVRDTEFTVDARELTNDALAWLKTRGTDEPFFLWLHYLDPHWPCQMTGKPPAPEDLLDAWNDYAVFLHQVMPSHGTFDPGEEMRLRWARRYRECLTAADQEIGRLLEALRMRPDWDRIIVAATGDHGEEFYERGTWYHSWNQLHREGVQVPLLIRVPGCRHQSIDTPVGLLDLAPTLLDFAGIAAPPAMIGGSLRPLTEENHCNPRPVFTEMVGHVNSVAYRLAIREDEWTYIYDFEKPHESKLFHVPDDPEEKVNLRDSCQSVFRRFEQMRFAHTALGLVNLMQPQPATRGSGTEAVDAASEFISEDLGLSGDNLMREQLEALGYL